jgi:hypothetical protein
MLLTTPQSRQLLHPLLAVPHLQMLRMNPHLHPLVDQPAVHRIDVVLHMQQTSRVDRRLQPVETLQTPRRQRTQQRTLLGQATLATRVATLD